MLTRSSKKNVLLLAAVTAIGLTSLAAHAGTIADFKAALNTTPVSATINDVIVTNVIPFAGTPSSESFQVQDPTGAIEVFSMATSTYTPHVGDVIDVTGLSEAFRGLYESHSPYTVTVDATGNATPPPSIFTTADFQSGAPAFIQSLIGTMSNVTFTSTGTFAGNGTYAVTDGVLNATIFVPSANPLIGQAIPTGPVDITGYSSEFDGSVASNTPPDNTGHELVPLSIVAAAPEPASLAILGAAGMAIFARRRRQR